ncbi:hypothetical protein PF005_g6106 [Phytophthora fragariae]|uniref:Uncharacterized protein n=2 Tax=Phytophthora TaxID=4783 RepID=A0A6A3ZWB1_9STRA|nr:hypothetical protein PF003_g29551 [Phytophthora fragariae]KAE9039483.1 hypothetical protein PR002_g5475 [Phytophthora rubi]KAE8943704.1 hypothetical protein PF009_g6588 [Phytophthora fragariae]KAE9025983.1 hypothetical protein PF011_g2779 [Phytophthora fragariae]KAE9045096.1 hypothetical protein PR001_g5107 [Phytophthora rubi]
MDRTFAAFSARPSIKCLTTLSLCLLVKLLRLCLGSLGPVPVVRRRPSCCGIAAEAELDCQMQCNGCACPVCRLAHKAR